MPSAEPPRLLISVRSATEAKAALSGGCDLLDLKEPHRGSLGMVDPSTIAEVIEIGPSVPVSVALGELSDWETTTELPPLPAGITYCKLGLAGQATRKSWKSEWLQVRDSFAENSNSDLNWVAVVYADHFAAHSPVPEEIIAAATETGCAGVLFDTFSKRSETLLDSIEPEALKLLGDTIHTAGLFVALAGSLTIACFPDVLSLQPDIVAVRGAVCGTEGRTGELVPEKVAEIKKLLQPASLTR